MTRIVGIDPGNTGALALLDDGELTVVDDMPLITVSTKERVDEQCVIDILIEFGPVDLVLIEFTNAVFGSSAGSAYSFGYGAGVLATAVTALGRPWQYVKPPAWTKAMGVTPDKDTHRQTAARLFPARAELFKRKRDDGRADAALIAEYGRRLHAGGN